MTTSEKAQGLVYRLRNVSKGRAPDSLLEEAAREIERLDERVDDLMAALYDKRRETTMEAVAAFSFFLFFITLVVVTFIQLVV